jgi:hypothetical protein
MKYITRAACLVLITCLGTGLLAAPPPQASPDERLFQEAKILIFDKKWDAALAKLEELRDAHPDSALAGQALFYRAECLGAIGGREREALQAYKDYIGLPGANASLTEESEGSIVDLAYGLFEKGDKTALKDVESRLDHPDRAVRYYAAYKLSLVADKRMASKAVPVLQQIIETEKDPELRDRARIALLRISPESLKTVEDRRASQGTPHLLRIRVWKKSQKEPVLSLNIPWSLADLAISAMPDEEKAAIREKGYDLNRIMNELAKSKESILKIVADDGTIIEIWIE